MATAGDGVLWWSLSIDHLPGSIHQEEGGVGSLERAKRPSEDGAPQAAQQEARQSARPRGDGYDAQVAALAPAEQPGYEEQAARRAPDGADREADLRWKASQLHSVMQSAWTDCSTAMDAWSRRATAVGACYAEAHDRFNAVRRQQAEVDALQAAACFSILQVATGGALASLTSLAKRSSALKDAPAWQVDGLTSVVTGALGKAVDGIAKPTYVTPGVDITPSKFATGLTIAVQGHAQGCLEHLNGWVQLANSIKLGKLPLSLVDYLDPGQLDAHIEAWKSTKEIFRRPGTLDTEALTEELETGMWARWVQGLTYLQEVGGKYTSRTVRHYISPGGLIEERLSELTGRDFDSGWYTSDDEVKALIDWGRSWKPTTRYSI
ncbi:MAG: hypothetical protein ACQEXJ_15600 [Myxococcota bacterium]